MWEWHTALGDSILKGSVRDLELSMCCWLLAVSGGAEDVSSGLGQEHTGCGAWIFSEGHGGPVISMNRRWQAKERLLQNEKHMAAAKAE